MHWLPAQVGNLVCPVKLLTVPAFPFSGRHSEDPQFASRMFLRPLIFIFHDALSQSFLRESFSVVKRTCRSHCSPNHLTDLRYPGSARRVGIQQINNTRTLCQYRIDCPENRSRKESSRTENRQVSQKVYLIVTAGRCRCSPHEQPQSQQHSRAAFGRGEPKYMNN